MTTATATHLRDRILGTALVKMRTLIEHHPDRTPVFTDGGRWHLDEDAWAPAWTGGFLAGSLWLLCDYSGDQWWRHQAERYTESLAPRRHDNGTHDIGFLFTPSWSRWRSAKDTDHVRGVLVDAGRTMARRFRETGGYLCSWVAPGSSFIDIMMNVDVIFEAASISGDAALFEIARRHAATSRRHLVRGDGTTIHEGWWDTDTGEFLRSATHQGERADSSWVRGQAWALYGFTQVFERTGYLDFAATARAIADSYLSRAGDALPPNDWETAADGRDVEASAAAVAAAGLMRLADALGAGGAAYRAAAVRTLDLLVKGGYVSSPNDDWAGTLKHATYHRANGLGIDESVMWGEYYLIEAASRLTENGV